MSEIILTERDLMGAIAYTAFSQCPNRQPRNIEVVMDTVKHQIRADFTNNGEWYYKKTEPKDVYQYVDDLLKSIPEFVDWNLSLLEIEKGVKVDDESRPNFGFVSRYDHETPDSWKSDFVDLDAFVNNVCRTLDYIREGEKL